MMKTFSLKWFGLSVALFFLTIPSYCRADELTAHARRDTYYQGEKPGQWAVMLRFNHPVFASNLSNSTKVSMDGAPENFELLDPGTDRKATGTMREFRLVPLGTPSKAGTVKITIDKSLSDASGRLLMQQEFTYQFLSAQTISVTTLGTYYKSKTDKGLNLEFSKPLEEDELMSAIKLKPAVSGLTVARLGDYRYRIKGNFELDKDYLLEIAPVVVNGGASVLTAPLSTPWMRASISA